MNWLSTEDRFVDKYGNRTFWPLQEACEQEWPVDEVRSKILERFEKWLDNVLSRQQWPEGIAAEILEQLQDDTVTTPAGTEDGNCDLYSLWSALTALTQETKLQGRSFKQLGESLLPMEGLVGSVASMLNRLEEMLNEGNDKLIKSARQQARAELADLLIDMRDRLGRGLEAVEALLSKLPRPNKQNLFSRLWNRQARQRTEAVIALAGGYSLTVERLSEALEQFGICRIHCLNRPFDPELMTAVDIEKNSQAEDGMVLEVYRTGYKWDDQVYRSAEVKVARNSSSLQCPPG